MEKQNSKIGNTVFCSKHGEQPAAAACGHLCGGGVDLGFFEPDSPDPHELFAWCFECELFFDEEGGCTEEFIKFSDPRIVCEPCFEKIKELNTVVYH